MREQIDLMESGALSSADLTAAYLDRIVERDDGDEGINAVIAVDPEAGATGAAADAARGGGALLQGAPILIKDNIDTAGLATTAGSLALANNVPDADAFVIARLREANAVILGKANLSEWANFRGNGSTSGWSSLGGQTRHALVASRNPCGSSSGSAAAVASGTATAALGTETNGSIICPASINGIVGFKPTVGLVSRAGVIPISSSQDTVGPMTKDVGDAARLMSVIAGPDPADPATAAIPAGFDFDFEAALATATLVNKRIGVYRAPGFSPSVNQVFDAELAVLEAAGAILVDVNLTDYDAADEYTVLTVEFKAGIDAYLASHARGGQSASLAELIQFNIDNAATVMPHFGQELFLDAQAAVAPTAMSYLDARARLRAAAGNGLLSELDGRGLVVIVAPSNGTAWTTNYETGDQFTGGSGHFSAAAGFPNLTVPMGEVNTLPVGMSFFGRPFGDAQVLAIGFAYERARGDRRRSVVGDEPISVEKHGTRPGM